MKGLTGKEVLLRKEQGLDNRMELDSGKTVSEIIFTNIFTYFNLIFAIITVLLVFVQSFRSLTFLPIVVGNTFIGIFQEIRAKRVLDKMSLLNAPSASVIRDGKEERIASSELVKDDVVVFEAGGQICADAVVLEGELQVNEALLTGEQDEISKKPGDSLMSGSFVVSGKAYAVLTQVGNASYIAKLAKEAKSLNREEPSQMIRAINRIVKWMGLLLLPIGGILFIQGYYYNHETLRDSVVSMVAALIGMIPEGLYLLTTVALALGTMRLAKNQVLLHDMKSIEALARVDVLCVDKTGTITEPKMKVFDVVSYTTTQVVVPPAEQSENSKAHILSLLSRYVDCSEDNNATMQALRAYMEEKKSDLMTIPAPELTGGLCKVFPFSSSVKYGAITFEKGTWFLGAVEFLIGEKRWKESYELLEQQVNSYSSKGYRVLLFGYQEGSYDPEKPLGEVEPVGLVLLANAIRQSAKKTFDYFRKQGVQIKVISGDNPMTVSEVAKEAGIEGAEKYVDAITLFHDTSRGAAGSAIKELPNGNSTLYHDASRGAAGSAIKELPNGNSTLDTPEKLAQAVSEYTVFGRVTPKQKQQLVRALRSQGHTVAMTGDGVNDILAMKDADCSIAMASGSEACAQAASVVLLDSDFSKMPRVVVEGRRVVNNIQRSASLFLVKNIFSLLLAVFFSIMMLTYPFEPSQISLISGFVIGIPGFFLALETNKNRIEGSFLKNVLLTALPAGLTDALIVGFLSICGRVFNLPKADISSAGTFLLAFVGFMILRKICLPWNRYRFLVFNGCILGLLLCSIFFQRLFALTVVSPSGAALLIAFCLAAESLFRNLTVLIKYLNEKMIPLVQRKRQIGLRWLERQEKRRKRN